MDQFVTKARHSREKLYPTARMWRYVGVYLPANLELFIPMAFVIKVTVSPGILGEEYMWRHAYACRAKYNRPGLKQHRMQMLPNEVVHFVGVNWRSGSKLSDDPDFYDFNARVNNAL